MDKFILPFKCIQSITVETLPPNQSLHTILIFTKIKDYKKGYNIVQYLHAIEPIMINNEHHFKVVRHKYEGIKTKNALPILENLRSLLSEKLIEDKNSQQAELDYHLGVEETYLDYVRSNSLEALLSAMELLGKAGILGEIDDFIDTIGKVPTPIHYTEILK